MIILCFLFSTGQKRRKYPRRGPIHPQDGGVPIVGLAWAAHSAPGLAVGGVA